MYNVVLLIIFCSLLSGCGLNNVINYIVEEVPSSNIYKSSIIDPYTGEEIKIWIPKDGMVMSKEWESFSRAEESRCSSGYYRGKNDAQLLPSQRGVYKKLSNGGLIWAYYYYYGEDSPLATGGTMTNWYETIFNIYVKPDGTIYGCVWKKYPLGGSDKYSTPDGINPRIHPPR